MNTHGNELVQYQSGYKQYCGQAVNYRNRYQKLFLSITSGIDICRVNKWGFQLQQTEIDTLILISMNEMKKYENNCNFLIHR